jgi:hypothetical protein
MTGIRLQDIPQRETPLAQIISKLQEEGMNKKDIDKQLIEMHDHGDIMLIPRRIVGRNPVEMANIAVMVGSRPYTAIKRSC